MKRIFALIPVLLLLFLLISCEVKEIEEGSFGITYPPDGATNVELRPTITFYDSSDAPTVYDVYLDGKIVVLGTSSTSVQIKEDLPPDTYHTVLIVKKILGKIEQRAKATFKTTRPPSKPFYVFPPDGYEFILGGAMEWSVRDPDGDPLTFSVYMGNSPDRLEEVATSLKDPHYFPKGLRDGSEYYWKVVAMDDKGARSESDVYSFKAVVPEGMRKYVYSVGDDRAGMYVIDISDISSPTEVKRFFEISFPDPQENYIGVAAYANYLYVSSNNDRANFIKIYDVSNGGNPVEVNELEVDFYGDLYVFDGFLVMHGWDFDVYSLIDPLNPENLYRISMANGCNGEEDISYSEGKLFVMTSYYAGNCDIPTVDLKVVELGSGKILYQTIFNPGRWMSGVAVKGNYMYTIVRDDKWGGTASIRVYDISDLENLDLGNPINEIPVEDFSYWRLKVHGDYLWLYGCDKLYKIDISDPTNPAPAGGVENLGCCGCIKNLSFTSNYVLAAAENRGIRIYDQDTLEQVGFFDKDGCYPLSVEKVGDYIYVYDSEYRKVVIYDKDLNLVKEIPVEGGGDMKFYENVLYVGVGGSVYAVDVSDPLNPKLSEDEAKLVGNLGGEVMGFKIVDKKLYVLTNSGVYVYDISDPNNPSQITSISVPNDSLRSFDTDGNTIVVGSDNDNRPGIYLIRDGKIVAQNTGYFVRYWIRIIGDYIVASVRDKDGRHSIVVFDSKNLSQVRTIGSDESWIGEIKGNYLITMKCGGEIEVYDVSKLPNLPKVLSTESRVGDCVNGYVMDEDTLYVIFNWRGIFKYDFSDVLNPSLLAERDWFKSVQIAVVGE